MFNTIKRKKIVYCNILFVNPLAKWFLSYFTIHNYKLQIYSYIYNFNLSLLGICKRIYIDIWNCYM